MSSNIPAVSFKKIDKKFGHLIANNQVSFDIQKGTVHAIVGENGAGKSTIVKILYGYQQPSGGHIELNGKKVSIENSQIALNLGIGMVHQHFMLVNAMTVLENILIGNPFLKYGSILEFNKAIETIKEKSNEFNLQFDLNRYIRDLSVGTKQRLEIFKTILQDIDILILDEPSSVLTKLEVIDLFAIIRKLQENNKTVIIITHKLDEVMEISDNITVMRGGKVIDTVATKNTTIEDLAGMMVGHKVPEPQKPPTQYGDKLLTIDNLSYKEDNRQVLDDINFSIRRGEILGLAGISGNGQNELEQILSGMITKGIEGKIYYKNENLAGQNSSYVRGLKIAHIPSDRTKWGYIDGWDNFKNAFLGYQFWQAFNKLNCWLEENKIFKFVSKVLNDYRVTPNSHKALTKSLSGGNQQKLIVGREMGSNPDLLIIAEPTQGVDIGSVAFIHQQLLDAKKEGKGILLISSELNEIKALADKSYVISQGKIVGEIDWQTDDEQKIGLMMIGKADKLANKAAS